MVEKATANRNSAASPRSLDMGDAAPPARAERPGAKGMGKRAGFAGGRATSSHQRGRQALVEGDSEGRSPRPPSLSAGDAGGRPMSVSRMTILGSWPDDRRVRISIPGDTPRLGAAWPAIPARFSTRGASTPPSADPDACLVRNFIAAAPAWASTRIATKDFSARVVSVFWGIRPSSGRWRGLRRTDPPPRSRLASGDVCVLQGEARLAYHGWSGAGRLLDTIPGGGRANRTSPRRAR